MKIEEIVFPIDFSERSVEACPYVAALTRRLGAKLTLLHVVESLPPGSSPFLHSAACWSETRRNASLSMEGSVKGA